MKLVHGLGLMILACVACACAAAPSQSLGAQPASPYGNAKSAEAADQLPPAPPGAYPTSAAGAGQPRPEAPSSTQRSYAQAPPPLPIGPSLGGADSKKARDLIEDFAVAEAAVLNAGADCSNACRALRSMQRATARLCSIAANEEERDRCKAAQDRVRAARERVRSSCGQCSGGPSLDPNAPIDEP